MKGVNFFDCINALISDAVNFVALEKSRNDLKTKNKEEEEEKRKKYHCINMQSNTPHLIKHKEKYLIHLYFSFVSSIQTASPVAKYF